MKAFKIGLIALLISAGFAVAPIHAQDATLEPIPTESPTDTTPAVEPGSPIPLEDAASTIIEQVMAVVASYAAIVGTAATIIVSFLKLVPWFSNPDNISGGTLNFVVNALLVIGYWLASAFGLLPTYLLGLARVENIGQLLLALVSGVIGSFFIHNQSVKGKIAFLGYQRSPA